MMLFNRACCCALLALTVAAVLPVSAQIATVHDRPVASPPVRPQTRQELQHREALKLYALSLVYERSNRLLDALYTLEEAVKLDPEAAAVHRALIPLYLALERIEDALAACRKVLDLQPGDYEIWYLYARQLRGQGHNQEAQTALSRALDCPELNDRLDLRVQIYFEQGTLAESLHEFDRAEAAFRHVVTILEHPQELIEQGPFSQDEIDLQVAETYERLGKVCLQSHHYDRANSYFLSARNKFREKDPARAKRFSQNLARVFIQQKKWAKALEAINEYLQTQPQDTEPYESKIEILEQLGRRQDILPELRKHAEQDRHNLSLNLLLARQCGRDGDYPSAEAMYRRLARVNPVPSVYRGLFELYRRQDQQNGGVAGMNRLLGLLDQSLARAFPSKKEQVADADEAARSRAMLSILRDDPKLVQGLLIVAARKLQQDETLHRQTCYFLAVLAARAHQLDHAERFYRSCLKATGANALNNEAEIYSGLIRVLQQAHKYDAVVEVCRHGLAHTQATNHILFHIELAQTLIRLGKTEEALQEANRAVDLAPDQSRLLCRRIRVQILGQAKRYDKAVAECQALLKEYKLPGEVRDIRHTLSVVYSMARDYVHTEEQLQMILREDANDATANNDLGYHWADQGKNLEEAEKLIRKALDLDRQQRTSRGVVSPDIDQDNAAYIDSLGWILFRRGQYQAARRELEKAVTLPDGTEDPVVWDHLGDVYFRLEDEVRARNAWKKALELYEITRSRPLDDRFYEIKQKLSTIEAGEE